MRPGQDSLDGGGPGLGGRRGAAGKAEGGEELPLFSALIQHSPDASCLLASTDSLDIESLMAEGEGGKGGGQPGERRDSGSGVSWGAASLSSLTAPDLEGSPLLFSDTEKSDDECLPRSRRPSDGAGPASAELEHFRRTLQLLGLDCSRTWDGILSWASGLLLICVVPALAYFWIEPRDSAPEHQLPFRLLVSSMESSLAAVAFLFLHSTVREHGLRGVLLLEEASEETVAVQREYSRCLKRANSLLLRLFAPAFLLHLTQKFWLFWEVPLRLLPVDLPPSYRAPELLLVALLTSAAWIFQTTTFLFVCVIFWNLCTLQELKMMSYREQVRKCGDPAFCFREYSRTVSGLAVISRRFRLFLALTGGVTLFGALASMYEMVLYRDGHLTFFNSGNVCVVNWVALMGAGLCLRSASKIAHLHRRIIKVACTMHAQQTYEGAQRAASSPGEGDPQGPMEALQALSQRQEAWAQRAALVTYLSNTTAGISVYGFVLDRTLVHTTLGALLTTTWFILGRSLTGALPTVTRLWNSSAHSL